MEREDLKQIFLCPVTTLKQSLRGLVLLVNTWSITQACYWLTLIPKLTHISIYSLTHGSTFIIMANSPLAPYAPGWLLLTLLFYFPPSLYFLPILSAWLLASQYFIKSI